MKTFLTITAMALMSTGAYADCVKLSANYAGAPAQKCTGTTSGNGQPATGTVAIVQNSRSQFKNRTVALEMIEWALYHKYLDWT